MIFKVYMEREEAKMDARRAASSRSARGAGTFKSEKDVAAFAEHVQKLAAKKV